MSDLRFTVPERCLLLQEIGRMEGLSFGAALEFVDRLFACGILSSPGETREAVDPEHLGMLIRLVSGRQDIGVRDRRVLMQKLASAGMEASAGIAPRDILAAILGRISMVLRRIPARNEARTVPARDPDPVEEAGRIVANMGRGLTSRDGIGAPGCRRGSGRCGEYEVVDDLITRAMLGDEMYERFVDGPEKRRRGVRTRKKSTNREEEEYDPYCREPADREFAQWLRGDEYYD